MSELRLNLVTGDWVIIATDRACRPNDFVSGINNQNVPAHDQECPFCLGNENMTPNEILHYPEDGPWQLRVVPNRFPALSTSAQPIRDNNGRLHRIGGFGSHEVIIESPVHNQNLTDLHQNQICQLLCIYRERFIQLYNTPGIEHVIIFKNYGEAAGTSLAHPHSQIIATPVVPIQMRERMHEYVRYFDHTGECLMCSTLADELHDGRRILLESEHFVSFVPYAALSPFHLWLFPRRHEHRFGLISNEELQDMADHLQKLLKLLKLAVGDPSYNFTIRSDSMHSVHQQCCHWYLSIVPRVTQVAGFEMGSGMYINASIPEESAAFLQSFLPQILEGSGA